MTQNMAAPWLQADWGQPFLQLIFIFIVAGVSTGSYESATDDILQPYKFFHGPRHKNRYVRDCQPKHHGNTTHETFAAHESLNKSVPLVETRHFTVAVGEYWNRRYVSGHYSVVYNPRKTLSVLEPGGHGGCQDNRRETVKQTARTRHCVLAHNAGFFNTTSGSCLGNVVSDGQLVLDSGGIQNAQFGIQKDGQLYVGYLAEDVLLGETFQQLVAGVMWLVRNGTNYIDTSKKAECSETQESGHLQYFIDVHSARTAIGHDKEGRVILVAIDGKTGQRGLNLPELSKLLISWGVVNAINLDGGGSVTSVINDTLVNYPSDTCKDDHRFNCARRVSTVVCVHDLDCEDCSNHGNCINGECHCHSNWAGHKCDRLLCGKHNCSNHGVCEEGGCSCNPGRYGKDCDMVCKAGTYGRQCQQSCLCQNEAVCHPASGSCKCPPGFTGRFCDKVCPAGYYGAGCTQPCYCPNSCTCHPVTGSCNTTVTDKAIQQVSQCLLKHMITEHHLVVDQPEQYKLWLISIITLSCVAAASIILNFALMCLNCSCACGNNNHRYRSFGKETRPLQRQFLVESPGSSEGDLESEAEEFELPQFPLQKGRNNLGS